MSSYYDSFSKRATTELIDIPEKTAPGSPDANVGRLYVADDGGTTKLYFKDAAGTATSLLDTATVAWDDIADPDGAGTIAFSTHAQVITSAKTDGDMLTISGVGAFGDVSVVKIQSSTGNPTDGTVLEVVSHDANVDPLVVSSSAQAGVLTVTQGGAVSVTGAVTASGSVTATGGLSAGSASDSLLKTDTVEITNSQLKALRATPKVLVAAAGADKMIELVSAVLILDYGSEALTESADNLIIEYASSGVDATAAIETTSFIDATADAIALVLPTGIAGAAATNLVNDGLHLKNSGDGEFGGNASNDTTMTVKVTYRVHTVGLA
ncbi:MAG: hypothetical protein V2I40_10975 [Desulfobacteraceae bacterium]|jgi:hypothetical protein|nr:hypothetical protein [Desulfobacteraceae bacterium]